MMLQLGAIKKVCKNFFFPSSSPIKDREGEELWREIHSRCESEESNFPSGDLEVPIYQEYLHDPRKLFTQRP